jgi:uncharacterized protein
VIRAVLDTNVLASAFVRPEPAPGQLLQARNDGRFLLPISEHILAELADTFEEPYFASRLPPAQRAENLALLRQKAALILPTALVHGVATHPEDDVVLATAVAAQAEYPVIGDGRFRRRVPAHHGVQLVSPREFLELLQAEGEAGER